MHTLPSIGTEDNAISVKRIMSRVGNMVAGSSPVRNVYTHYYRWENVRWDMKESLLQRSKDHRQIAGLPEPKRQRGPDGKPLVKKTPEQQYPIKMLDRVFKQLKDQRSVPMVFQLMRYLAKRGLDPISEGEAQALEQYIQDDQRQ